MRNEMHQVASRCSGCRKHVADSRTHTMQAVAFAKKYVLEKGPIILEMDTYRYHGHSMSDPGSTYRTRDEISSMRQLRDPIEHVRKLLLEKAGADPAELKKIEKVLLMLA